MDTTTAAARSTDAPGWWRRPLADLLDVVLVVLGGLLAGGAVAAALLADSAGDPWAELGAALLGMGAGLLTALGLWIVLLVLVARRGTSPGSRALGLDTTAVPSTAGRHVAVVVVLWAGAGAVLAAVEPWPAGPLGGALAAAIATGAALAAWGRGPLRTRLQVVGVAAVAGLLVAGAVPDRAPHLWELRPQAQAAVRGALEDDPAARRACGGAAAGPLASHATAPCHDPDREWLVDRHPAVVAEHLSAAAAGAVGSHAAVRTVAIPGGREVRVDDATVAIVLPRGDACDSRVVVAGWARTTPPQQGDGTCR